MQPVRILIAEDFAAFRLILSSTLQQRSEFQVICETSEGFATVQKANELQPDLILLDIGLANLNGIEVARRIRTLSPDSKILFVSQESSAEVVEEALRLGAQGFLSKYDAASEFLLAVDAVLQGKQFVSSHLKAPVTSNRPQQIDTGRVHEVASYPDQASFVDGFTRFIEAALKLGNPVILVATEAHRTSIQHKLWTRGWDIEAAIQKGVYISLDADDTLSKFMVNDLPDATRFLEVAGNLIRTTKESHNGEHPRIAMCGECAPILWAQGKAEAAIELERLWDVIARTRDVDILCGYSLTGLCRSQNSHAFERICAQHSAAYSV